MNLPVFGITFAFLLILNISLIPNLYAQEAKSQLIGVNMLGYYTTLPQSREFKNPFPDNYYDQSFKII
jgi:hypothetical protein